MFLSTGANVHFILIILLFFFLKILSLRESYYALFMKKLYNHPYFSRALCYVVLLLLFGVYIFYIDENSISVRMQNKRYIKELRQEIELYQSNYDRDDRIVKQLSTSREVIERIAIEKYNMKREDQDIFIIHEP